MSETTAKKSMAESQTYEDHGSIVGDNNKELRGCKRPCPISNNYWRRVMAKELR